MARGRPKGSKNKFPRGQRPKNGKSRKKRLHYKYIVYNPQEKKPNYGEKTLRGYQVKAAWKRIKKRHKWCSIFFKRKNALGTVKKVLAAERAYGRKASQLGGNLVSAVRKWGKRGRRDLKRYLRNKRKTKYNRRIEVVPINE